MHPKIIVIFMATIAILIGLWLHNHMERLREKLKSKNQILPPASPLARPQSVLKPFLPPTPEPFFKKEDPNKLLKDRLRERKASGSSLGTAVPSTMAEFGDRVSRDDVIQAALQVGYPLPEVATFMAANQYQPTEIAKMIVDNGNLDVYQLGLVIMPLIKGETLAERAGETFEIVKDAFQGSGQYECEDDDKDLIKLPGQLGCSPEEAAVILHNKTELRLGKIVRKLALASSPELVAKLAKYLDVDLSDEEEYSDLREDDDVTFDAAAKILKACGKDVEDIVRAENEDDDDFAEFFVALSRAGFSPREILAGIYAAEVIDDSLLAAIVDAAVTQGVPLDDIVAFLHQEDVEGDDLDQEMRDLDVDLKTRIDVLHAFLYSAPPSQASST